MKNAKKITCLGTIVLFLLLISSCGVDTKQTTPCPECPCVEADETYDQGIIFPEEARQLYVNYEKRRVNLIQEYEDSLDEKEQGKMQNGQESNTADSNGSKFDVARYVYYDYEDLKKYMAYIENEAKLSGEKLTTLRFYFANYPNDEKFPDGKAVVHPRQNSIMMSPTIQRDGKEYIFYTEDAQDGKRRAVLLANDFQRRKGEGTNEKSQAESKSEASLAPSFASPAPVFADRSTTKNEGSSAPPPY
ncbi:hypothetical protein [Pareuzebyella sediminis]|uniref:hypothetical protein n=1 Tax=Pareuzebyella sediminis TaxID=2607998 RepID=UPI0011EDCBF3|nr:hypothetical protein [Pareuzebyella sediminis]